MKKIMATVISIVAIVYYIVDSLLHIDFSEKKAVIALIFFIFPYIFSSLINGYFLLHSLFKKARDINDNNIITIIAILGSNLAIFVGLFTDLNAPNPDPTLLSIGIALRLIPLPFYIIGLITLGYNLSILPEANSLNTKGIYSISRHPLYVCYIIWFFLQILICQTLLIVFISIIQSVLLVLRAKYEEKILEKNFPEYKKYRETVWWIGRAKKYQPVRNEGQLT